MPLKSTGGKDSCTWDTFFGFPPEGRWMIGDQKIGGVRGGGWKKGFGEEALSHMGESGKNAAAAAAGKS